MIIFLTDGLPTAGVTDVDKIAENVAKAAPKNVRLFPFGVGYDVNTVLLDTLASQNRGASAYVKPEENIEDSVSSFYAKVGQPVLTDLKLDLGAARAYDVYPNPLPDLFAGSQLVLAGRYRGDGSVTITLSGVSGDKEARFTYTGDFPKSSLLDPSVARLWATRKVGYLLTQIRLHGADKELVNEIVDLATRFGIVTPYTSFLVDERQNLALPGAPKAAAEQLFGQLATPAPAAGPQAVQNSQSLDALRSGSQGAGQAPGQMKQVGDKAFVLRQGRLDRHHLQRGHEAGQGCLRQRRPLRPAGRSPGVGQVLRRGRPAHGGAGRRSLPGGRRGRAAAGYPRHAHGYAAERRHPRGDAHRGANGNANARPRGPAPRRRPRLVAHAGGSRRAARPSRVRWSGSGSGSLALFGNR